jgi:hypothetical protein
VKDFLRGIAALPETDFAQTDIKTNDTMLNWDETDGNSNVGQVQIADIGDAAYVPDCYAIFGRQVGNWMSRSPMHLAFPNITT